MPLQLPAPPVFSPNRRRKALDLPAASLAKGLMNWLLSIPTTKKEIDANQHQHIEKPFPTSKTSHGIMLRPWRWKHSKVKGNLAHGSNSWSVWNHQFDPRTDWWELWHKICGSSAGEKQVQSMVSNMLGLNQLFDQVHCNAGKPGSSPTTPLLPTTSTTHQSYLL